MELAACSGQPSSLRSRRWFERSCSCYLRTVRGIVRFRVVARRVPGQGHEHLVQARAGEREVADRDSGTEEFGDRPSGILWISDKCGKHRRIGTTCACSPERHPLHTGALGEPMGILQADVNVAATTDALIGAVRSATRCASSRPSPTCSLVEYCVGEPPSCCRRRGPGRSSRSGCDLGIETGVSSSRKSTSGRTTMLAARSSRRCMPPE